MFRACAIILPQHSTLISLRSMRFQAYLTWRARKTQQLITRLTVFLGKPNRWSASLELFLILWNSKFHTLNHLSLRLELPALSQAQPVHTPLSYFFNIRFNIILPSPISSVPHQKPACNSLPFQPQHIHRSFHSPWFYHLNLYLGNKNTKLLVMQISVSPCYVLPTLFRNTIQITVKNYN